MKKAIENTNSFLSSPKNETEANLYNTYITNRQQFWAELVTKKKQFWAYRRMSFRTQSFGLTIVLDWKLFFFCLWLKKMILRFRNLILKVTIERLILFLSSPSLDWFLWYTKTKNMYYALVSSCDLLLQSPTSSFIHLCCIDGGKGYRTRRT